MQASFVTKPAAARAGLRAQRSRPILTKVNGDLCSGRVPPSLAIRCGLSPSEQRDRRSASPRNWGARSAAPPRRNAKRGSRRQDAVRLTPSHSTLRSLGRLNLQQGGTVCRRAAPVRVVAPDTAVTAG